jgi:hypothetical protein
MAAIWRNGATRCKIGEAWSSFDEKLHATTPDVAVSRQVRFRRRFVAERAHPLDDIKSDIARITRFEPSMNEAALQRFRQTFYHGDGQLLRRLGHARFEKFIFGAQHLCHSQNRRTHIASKDFFNERDEFVPDAIAGMAGVLVGVIVAIIEMMLRDVGINFRAPRFKKRTNDRHFHSIDQAHALPSHAAQSGNA